ncbi:MAG TPA: hypothetical protein IAA51_06800 [Candidatus Cottocaccamicrobium excrementipullorum]|nr:hypothetical protein [Candidatus Cottocaccamicrobium excrementipullorum]
MYRILGIETVDYVSRKTGNRVQGTRLHLQDGTAYEDTMGNRVLSVYVKPAVNTADLALGDDVEVLYNRFGSVDDVRRVG